MRKRFEFLKHKQFYVGLFIFIVSIVLNILDSWYLLGVYPGQLPVVYDLILNNIPYYNVAYLYDLFLILTVILFAVFIFHKKDENKIGYYLFLFGAYYIIRSFFLILTPLSNPAGNYNQIFNGWFFSIGVYPSGHVGTCFLILLLTKGVYRYLIFLLFLGVLISLFLSRGHYSIDILSGVIFSFAVFAFGQKYMKKHFVE